MEKNLILKNFLNRIYADYCMPSRLSEFEKILKTALDNGYQHLSLIQFYDLIVNKKINSSDKYFIHRHDIDTDKTTARKIFELEKKYQVKSSFYFRLSTIDYDLMREINDYGSEASYHFEELAAYCKKHKIISKEIALKNFDTMREIFKKKFLMVENNLGYKLRSVVSHGDFVNRKLGMTNSVLINETLRHELKIDVEGYDKILLNNYSVILSDTTYPFFYKLISPFDAFEKKYQVIYLLTHPRHWHTNIVENTKDNLKRLYEGLTYSF